MPLLPSHPSARREGLSVRLRLILLFPLLFGSFALGQPQPPDVSGPINVTPKPVASDASVKLD